MTVKMTSSLNRTPVTTPPKPSIDLDKVAKGAIHAVTNSELFRDLFKKAPTTHGEYKQTLRGLSDTMLASEKSRLESQIRDASTGPVADAQAVTRLKAQLAEVEEELKARDGFATSKDPAYARDMHGKATPEVQAEIARQSERYREATTGAFTDPAAAADAKEKIAMLQKELFGRVMDAFQGKLPEDPPTEKMNILSKLGYGFSLANKDAAGLAAEKMKQESILADATTGSHQDPIAAENARTKLAMIAEREAKLAATPQSIESYRKDLRGMSDAELKTERAKLARVASDAGRGAAKDPEAAELAKKKLAEIDAEVSLRTQLASGPQPEYATQMHGASDEALRAETARQQEALRDANTGLFKDPLAAKDAAEKLTVLMREQLRRLGSHYAGNLPVDPPTKPISDRELKNVSALLRDDSPEELASKKKWLEQTLRDATSGAHVDPIKAANAQKQLDLLKKEEALRADLAKGPQGDYALQVHGNSDLSNMLELARQKERYREATTGAFTDPAAARDAAEKIKVLEAEQSRRAPPLPFNFKVPLVG